MTSTISETVAELNRNPFTGRTTTTPRPFAEDPNVVYLDEAHLRQKQAQWDAAERWRAEGAAIGEARRAQLDGDREADATRRQQEARADLEAAVKQRFLAKAGATVNDWERLKGQLIDQELISAPNPIEVEKARLVASGRYPQF